jgi:DNA-binding transcriptional MerR regulator
VSSDAPRYGIDELADLGGVSRRTVRYYVQEALLPSPLGVGRGSHYGPEHLDALLKVKAMQEAGRTLGQIRQALSGGGTEAIDSSSPPPARPPSAVWRRVSLAPGVELHVAGDIRLPSAARLDQLVEWCRAHLRRPGEDDDENR